MNQLPKGETEKGLEELNGCPAIPQVPANITEDNVKSWHDTVQELIACYKKNNLRAETFKEVMETIQEKQKIIRESLDNARKLEGENYQKQKKDLVERIERRTKENAERESGPLVVELAETKKNLAELRRVIERHQARMEKDKVSYAAMAKEYLEFKNTEAKSTSELKRIAEEGSTSTFESIAKLQTDLVALTQVESGRPQSVIIQAKRLIRQLEYDIEDYEKELAQFIPFMQKQKIKQPDLAGEAIQVLKKMVGYCEDRSQKFLAAIDSLMDGLIQRRKALIAMEAEKETRETIAQAAFLEASAKFLKGVNLKIKELWQLPERSKVLDLPLFGDDYHRVLSFIMQEKMCSAQKADWMETGCNIMKGEFAKAKKHLAQTLPFSIQINLIILRRAKINNQLLDLVETSLKKNQLAAAIADYDAAVNLSDAPKDSEAAE
jgi:hypothetical protein